MWFFICLTLLSWNLAKSDEPWSSFACKDLNAPFIPKHDTLTYYQFTCLLWTVSTQFNVNILSGMQRYHFSELIRYQKCWGSADTDPTRYQCSFFFFYQCRISMLLCVKHNLLKYFSTGRSTVLGMQPKSGSRDRSECVVDCIQQKKPQSTKT